MEKCGTQQKVIEDNELFTSEELVESSDKNEVWSVARNEETEHPSEGSSTTESGTYYFYNKCEIILKRFEKKSVILNLLLNIYKNRILLNYCYYHVNQDIAIKNVKLNLFMHFNYRI